MSESDDDKFIAWAQKKVGIYLTDKDEDRLFALARRGAGLTLDRQRLVAYPDGSEWVEEIYSRFMPLPPPPAGEQE